MKKYLPIIFSILLFHASVAISGMGMSGSIVNEKPDGETIQVVFYGDLMMGPDRVMSNAVVKGVGQFLILNSYNGLDMRTSSPISKLTKSSIELSLNGKTKSFQITKDTTFCDLNGNRMKRKSFGIDNMVTISSRLDEKAASYIRVGPMFFSGVMAGSAKLRDIGCKE